jgi:4-hydroxythreonine-4-phosphate dehydrogenase
MTLAGFVKPRIAIAAVNPHAGEDGTCGSEEREIIEPAVKRALQNGMNVCGPFSADTLFVKLFNGEFNGAVTMYHDQSQIAMKLKSFDDGVTVMGGFPYPVTTCSHGTASDIAGRGTANPGAFENAFRIACEMAAAGKLGETRSCG